MSHRLDVDVVVVGAGMAGLAAADALVCAGIDTMVIEARDRPGGRIRADNGLQVGGEFIGRPHVRSRALVSRLGLSLRPMPRSGPILWRTGGRTRAGRVPPVPMAEIPAAVRALARLRRDAMALDPARPWASPGAEQMDATSTAQHLQRIGGGLQATELLSALIAGFATTGVQDLSALHSTWWIGRAGGLAAALASGTGSQIPAGADALPTRFADAITAPIMYETAVTSVETHGALSRGGGYVRLITTTGSLRTKAAVLALPLPVLRRIPITPSLPGPLTAAMDDLTFGKATKISVLLESDRGCRVRAAVGGSPLGIVWRAGRVLSGITTEPGHEHHRLLDDLLGVFGVSDQAVRAWAVHDWSGDPLSGGSYITFAPGRLTRHGPALRRPHGRLAFAAAERSTWPNSIEGALESGRAAGRHVRDLLLPR
ncbi:hypothetical protein BJF79_32030 [Actinomadura sp. CNU-125]|uniref:flavin monoamine oxidase family protein n=1 Tax=Actinomadura sp. CNU-125 TaxID=1904961 RepID=UPI0009640591|nr:NAD(P)/FAD-dependent oxidoreductase [Actinomadura sp. CNU-125]OLT35745.1 hypothetical protein BJF79_32030 [Actinomadura sp. CNU-125]